MIFLLRVVRSSAHTTRPHKKTLGQIRNATMPQYYEIKIKGHLDSRWSDWFAGLELTHLEGDETLLSGLLPDQPALHGLLERIRDLNLILISVNSIGPSTPETEYRKEKT
jgi:hypothetical protein